MVPHRGFLKMGRFFSSVLASGLLFTQIAFAFSANDPIPDCPANDGTTIPVINKVVLEWKNGKPGEPPKANQFRSRAHLRGLVDKIYPDRNGHQHFEMQIGPNVDTDSVEVIYNEDFGALPHLARGMHVDACGDFIISTAQAGDYPPSPAGAIIHWVHMNPSHHGHPSGYVWIEGKLCGQEPDRRQQHQTDFMDTALQATPAYAQ